MMLLKVFFILISSGVAALKPPHAGFLESVKTKDGVVYTEVKRMGDYLLIYPMQYQGGGKWHPIPVNEISQGQITLTHPKIKKRTTLNLETQKEIFSVPLLYSKDPTLLISVQYTYKKQFLAFNYVLDNYEEHK